MLSKSASSAIVTALLQIPLLHLPSLVNKIIGEELGVRHVLEGSVRKAGEKVRKLPSKSHAQSLGGATALPQKAIALDDSNAEAHGLLGFEFSHKRHHERALSPAEKAIELSPSSSVLHFRLAMKFIFLPGTMKPLWNI
jgi:hypothetical protein